MLSLDFDSSLLIQQSAQGRIRLGLCCINNTLRKDQIFCSRTVDRKRFTTARAQELSIKNCEDILKLLEWNQQHSIHHLRLSSDLLPRYTDTTVESYEIPQEAIQALQKAGDFANEFNHRITMHPGQYNNIATYRDSVWELTCKDLTMHADILDTMQVNLEGIICVHGGGVYGDKEGTMRRWIERFDDLPRQVKDRLAIENCEKSYSVEDCLYIANECKIPMILDTHHYSCYGLYNDECQPEIEELLPFIIDTWDKHYNSTPLFHVSDSRDTLSSSQQCCAHHDYVKAIPRCLMEIPMLYDRNIDIEVEAKAKEAAIFQLYDTYPTVFNLHHLHQSQHI